MSHEVNEMAYVGEEPWHGLGVKLTEDASIDTWITEAGMDYKVMRSTVEYIYENGLRAYPAKDVLHNSKTGHPLGVVSNKYNIVQPDQCLEFYRELCATQGYKIETAGSLKDGAIYWALARTGIEDKINGDDTKLFVLLSSSADGTRATNARFTPIRVVCNNTMQMAMGMKSEKSINVSHRSTFDIVATHKALGLVDVDAAWNRFKEQMVSLHKVEVTWTEAKAFYTKLLRPIEDEDNTRKVRGLDELLEAYASAPGAVPGTAYGLVQGVTRFVDHTRGKDQGKRLTSAWFGQGNVMKQNALDNALLLVA